MFIAIFQNSRSVEAQSLSQLSSKQQFVLKMTSIIKNAEKIANELFCLKFRRWTNTSVYLDDSEMRLFKSTNYGMFKIFVKLPDFHNRGTFEANVSIRD